MEDACIITGILDLESPNSPNFQKPEGRVLGTVNVWDIPLIQSALKYSGPTHREYRTSEIDLNQRIASILPHFSAPREILESLQCLQQIKPGLTAIFLYKWY